MMPTCPSFPALDTTFSNFAPGFGRLHFPELIALPLCNGGFILIGLQLLSLFPPQLLLVQSLHFFPLWPFPPFAGSHHFCPFFTASFLSLLEPEALFASQAVSPHLSPPSSHQYPSISPFSRKQSDPSVCCRHSASRPDAIPLTLPLLWVNMSHASIILLSFCHYYAPWTSLHLFLQLFSSLLHCLSLFLFPRFVSLCSSHFSTDDKYLHQSSAISLECRLSSPSSSVFHAISLSPFRLSWPSPNIHPLCLSCFFPPRDRMTQSLLHG